MQRMNPFENVLNVHNVGKWGAVHGCLREHFLRVRRPNGRKSMD
jgi:hypothetical protein